jgi:hypothetical protein
MGVEPKSFVTGPVEGMRIFASLLSFRVSSMKVWLW